MKVTFRILFLVLSLGILVYAALPPPEPVEDAPSPDQESQPESLPQTPDSNLIRDFLGGPQLDAGNKAKDILNEVNEDRKKDLEELE
jgi:hypothetical protein